MRLQIVRLPRETIQEFAERHDLTMQVYERTHAECPDKYYAKFANSDIVEGCCLLGAYGNGHTIKSAIAAYAERISGCCLVIAGNTNSEIRINVPQLTSAPGAE